ncbi:MAG: hypothetical protein ABF477_03810 [Leuconostoc pseudomesenteroides]|uniref:hypothetical protein n=1 Tax=Leuconostoc pseudomesenteroides TaxID=33968 RepID=UPI0039EB8A36
MTFDEAIEYFRNNTDISGTAVFLNDVEDTLKELREEYAPTVEMTKLKHDVFAEEMEIYYITQEELDSFITDGLNLGDMTVRKGLNAWLHPETIKIVDE